ncbi:MAG: metalloregulator ArsR/SmtB family transcription factor [Chloroflexi bacterium]|nr:metalloregulator ArsR/SmtB family transcription factor [Chloroflexota bacterium]
MLTKAQQMDVLQLFKALADDTRFAMYAQLVQGEQSVGVLAEALQITEPTASHHLGKLRQVGLVTMRASGTHRMYSIDPGRVKYFKAMVGQIDQLDHSDEPEDKAWLDSLDVSEDDRKVFKDYFANGRLTQIPTKQKKLLVVLQWLATKFEANREYTEREVNAIVSEVHEDYATLRRNLIEFGFLRRERGGGRYWVTPEDEKGTQWVEF